MTGPKPRTSFFRLTRREGRKGSDHQYPINLPGISFLMLPWYALGRLLKGRWLTFVLKGSLSVWAALLGTQIYLLVRQRFKKEGLALGVWAITAFTAPIIFYATHLYPELPIALFSVYIFRKMTSDEAPTKRQILFMGFLLGTFFWFGVKYNFIFGPLVLVSCHALWFRHKARARVPLFLALPIVGAHRFLRRCLTRCTGRSRRWPSTRGSSRPSARGL